MSPKTVYFEQLQTDKQSLSGRIIDLSLRIDKQTNIFFNKKEKSDP